MEHKSTSSQEVKNSSVGLIFIYNFLLTLSKMTQKFVINNMCISDTNWAIRDNDRSIKSGWTEIDQLNAYTIGADGKWSENRYDECIQISKLNFYSFDWSLYFLLCMRVAIVFLHQEPKKNIIYAPTLQMKATFLLLIEDFSVGLRVRERFLLNFSHLNIKWNFRSESTLLNRQHW